MSTHYRPPQHCNACNVLLNAVNRKYGGMRQPWCRTCFASRPRHCITCGTSGPAAFGTGKRRTRCKPCRNRRDRGAPPSSLAYIDTLPLCDICGMRDSHVSEGKCVLCKREAARPKANRTPWREEAA